jgi:predicted nucleotide-binding protein
MRLLIHSPRPGQYVGHAVRLLGTLNESVPVMILRTVVKPETVNTYHPQTGRLLFDEGSGAIEGTTYVGNAQPGSHTNENFRIMVASCSPAAEQALNYYLAAAARQGWPGITELPEGTRTLAEVSVVRNDSEAETHVNPEPIPLIEKTDDRKVFIIHGRNIDARDTLAQFLRTLDLYPVDFDQLAADAGGTAFIGDIVRAGMRRARGIIALFTPDEFSALQPNLRKVHDTSDDTQRWQSRPNVIFEAGMAYGMAPERTILVTLGTEVTLFSDLYGVHFIRLGNDVQSRSRLRRKLLGVRCAVDQLSDAWTDPKESGDFVKCIEQFNPVSPRDPF